MTITTIQLVATLIQEGIKLYPSVQAIYQAAIDGREITHEMYEAARAELAALQINLPDIRPPSILDVPTSSMGALAGGTPI